MTTPARHFRYGPDAYAEIGVVKTVMAALRVVLDVLPDQPEEFEKLVGELRASIRAVDVSGLVAVRERMLDGVRHQLGQDNFDDPPGGDAADDDWQHL